MTGDTSYFPHLLLVIAAVLVAARLFGALAVKLGQQAILAELIAGVILGASVLGVLDPTEPVIQTLAELGLLVLLFEIGLETDLRKLGSVVGSATTVAIVGVVVSFAMGYVALKAIGVTQMGAIVCATALTATSVGVSTRVLADLGKLDSVEGRVVLGAAVLDDIIGLVLLSVVGSFVAGAAIHPTDIARTAGIAFGFLLVALLVGYFVVPPVFRAAHRKVFAPNTIAVTGLAFAFALAALAGLLGSALIIGGFVAGVVLNTLDESDEILNATRSIGSLLTPLFFASVGASVSLAAFRDPRTLMITAILVVLGSLGKFLAGYALVGFPGSRRLVGVSMIPRGEVELIVAQTGLAIGALDASLFGAITLTVLITALISPPLIQAAARAQAHRGAVAV
ncbi:MAG: cation:proton antiporter [Gemmatimonadaceae bacterium]|nr:cation:proton antiporter [Gemmatimonadaceae bacterium]